mgnify:CR=1 FL=1
MVMEKLCEKVVDGQKKSYRVMTVLMALEEEVVRIMCVCMVRKVAKQVQRKSVFMMVWGVSEIFTARER